MSIRKMIASTVGLAILSAAAAPLAAQAGSANMLYVEQDGVAGGAGNSLSIDQSKTSNSLVVGPSQNLLDAVDELSLGTGANIEQPGLAISNFDLMRGDTTNVLNNNPALQRGDGNQATLEITGDAATPGGTFQLQQAGAGGADGFDNVATATLTGATPNTLGAIIQFGNGNQAQLGLNGASTGLIAQTGNGLSANLTVEAGGNGQIIQNGNDSSASLGVAAGSNATYVQNGNGLSNDGAAVQVFSTNPGNITITQTGF